MKSTGAQSSNELQWLDLKIEHQDSNPSNDHQADIPTAGLSSVGLIAGCFVCLVHTCEKSMMNCMAGGVGNTQDDTNARIITH